MGEETISWPVSIAGCVIFTLLGVLVWYMQTKKGKWK